MPTSTSVLVRLSHNTLLLMKINADVTFKVTSAELVTFYSENERGKEGLLCNRSFALTDEYQSLTFRGRRCIGDWTFAISSCNKMKEAQPPGSVVPETVRPDLCRNQ